MTVYSPRQAETIPVPAWCVGTWGTAAAAARLLAVPPPLIHALIRRSGVRSERRGGEVIYALDDLWRAAGEVAR